MRRILGELSARLVVVLLVLSCAQQVKSSLSNHRYNVNDPVPLYGNKVGSSYFNPSETYAYYDLPFCSPDHPVGKKWSLGDVLNGDRFISTSYKLEFRIDKDFEVACTKTLTKKEIKKFQYAIDRSYEFQMCYDDFLVSGRIGRIDYFNPTHIRPREMGHYEIYNYNSQFRSFYGRADYNAKREDYAYRFFSHIDFQISYNNDRVICIFALVDEYSDNVVELKEDKEVQLNFSYSVSWFKTNDSFEERLYEFGRDRDWLSALESSFLVLVLLGCSLSVYAFVPQELHNTHAGDIEIVEKQEEISICYPKHKSLFAASIGCGTQMIVLVFFTLMVGLFRVQYKGGALRTGLVFTYVITSNVAGYASSSVYSQFQGTNWVQNIMLTGSLFNVPLFVTFSIINYVAVTYKMTSALAFGTILVLLFIWVFGALPLLLLGGMIAKNKGYNYNTRHYNATYSPEYSQLPWYKMGLAGLFSFGVMLLMYRELFYLRSSIWGQSRSNGAYMYTTYLILLIVATVTVIVTGSVTVALSYTQLCIENSEWQWRSFFTGGSTGFYVFGYCLYYYHQCTDMSGMLQTLVFVGYLACVSYGLFLLLGTVGFYASLLFVHYKHGSTKRE